MVVSSESRRIPTAEEVKAKLTTPAFFYGYTTHWKLVIVKDPNGSIIRGGEKYSAKRVMTGCENCQFKDVDALTDHLQKAYDRWASTHPHSRYAEFKDCIKPEEPVSPRENPFMHGFRLVMNPLPNQ